MKQPHTPKRPDFDPAPDADELGKLAHAAADLDTFEPIGAAALRVVARLQRKDAAE